MPPLPVPPEALAIALAVTGLAAAAQGTIGFGFAVLSVPVLAMLDARLAPVPQLLVTLPLVVSMAWRERRALDLRGAGWVLVGRVPGAALGLWLLWLASDRALHALLGCIIAAGVLILATGVRLPRTPLTKLLAGVVSGVSSLVASVGGPPIALLYRDAAGGQLRSTLSAIFAVGIVITLTTRILGGEIRSEEAHVALLLLPAVLVGLWVSGHLKGRVDGPLLRKSVLAVSFLAALGLIAKAVF